jgi:cytoskeletal protein CcmA (bactofilin family)
MRHLMVLLGLLPAAAGAFELPEHVHVQTEQSEDAYLIGDDVTIDAPLNGDFFAVAARVRLSGPVRGDVTVGAADVDILAPIDDDVRLVALSAAFNRPIGGDLFAAGRTLHVFPKSTVRGRMLLVAETIKFDGKAARKAMMIAKRIQVSGHVAGDLELEGAEVDILPDAVIGGDVIFRGGGQLNVDPRATIGGTVKKIPSPFQDMMDTGQHVKQAGQVTAKLLPWLWLLAVGAVVILFTPKLPRRAVYEMRAAPLVTAGLGLGVLVLMPLLAVALILSVVGMPFGVSLFAAYPLAILIGFVLGVVGLGDWALARWLGEKITGRLWRMVSFTASVAVLAILAQVPYVGWVPGFVALLFGLGGLALVRWQQMTRF